MAAGAELVVLAVETTGRLSKTPMGFINLLVESYDCRVLAMGREHPGSGAGAFAMPKEAFKRHVYARLAMVIGAETASMVVGANKASYRLTNVSSARRVNGDLVRARIQASRAAPTAPAAPRL